MPPSSPKPPDAYRSASEWESPRPGLLPPQTPVMVWHADSSGACVRFNRAWLEFTGRTLEQEVGSGWAAGVHPDDLGRCLATYAEAFESRRPFVMDHRLRRHDGAWRWVLNSGCPLETEAGGPGGYLGACVDVTEVKEALDERRRGATSSGIASEAVPQGRDPVPDGAPRHRRSPRADEPSHGHDGRSEDLAVGNPGEAEGLPDEEPAWVEGLHRTSDEASEALRRAHRAELERIRRQHQAQMEELTRLRTAELEALRHQQEDRVEALQREQERRLAELQRQCDGLLEELLHRVKNNAQVATSFLALQAARAEDTAVALALRGAATRVMLSSLVQDRMFAVAGAAGIELGPEVAVALRRAGEAAGRRGIRLEPRIEDALSVPGAQASPLVLIVNELVVNALRHGFPDGREGVVRVTLRRPAPDLGEIVVEDDGVGAAPSRLARPPRSCLGLHLVRRLARQARAEVWLEGTGSSTEGSRAAGDRLGGTRAVVSFRLA